jgi:hypothetical protein
MAMVMMVVVMYAACVKNIVDFPGKQNIILFTNFWTFRKEKECAILKDTQRKACTLLMSWKCAMVSLSVMPLVALA